MLRYGCEQDESIILNLIETQSISDCAVLTQTAATATAATLSVCRGTS